MFLKEFRDLRKKPDRLQGLPDVLNYAALVLPGVLLLKDGSLLAGFEYGGPDLNSASSGGTRRACLPGEQRISASGRRMDAERRSHSARKRRLSERGSIPRSHHCGDRSRAPAALLKRARTFRHSFRTYSHLQTGFRPSPTRSTAFLF